ncbi:hypothetical protein HII31_02441 [Pseudocercospora fuligena]|uniref:F-box domain-containing protein n=1 Tax=Pseudocercospora fuligena TaxID=685502 RepID=A0A8H6RRW9_9PEZI|nr:hypothetical protein HII31_02441 [Pseudocercospora fuligena]
MAKSRKTRGKRPRSPSPDASNKKIPTRKTDFPARSAVFATTELLENVLQHLPTKAIAMSQMVSRKFRDVVEESPTLQVKLFRQADDVAGHSQTPWAVRRSQTEVRQARRSSSLPNDHGMALVLVHETPIIGGDLQYICLREVELNWAIFEKKKWLNHHPTSRLYQLFVSGGEELTFTPGSTCSLIRSLRGETQSWERSYLCNPPCTRATIYLSINFGRKERQGFTKLSIVARVAKKEGITLADLLGAAFDKAVSPGQYGMSLMENYKAYAPTFDGCIRDLVKFLESKHSAEAWISSEDCLIKLQSLTVPTDEDRKRVVKIGERGDDEDQRGEARWWLAQTREKLTVTPEGSDNVSGDGNS